MRVYKRLLAGLALLLSAVVLLLSLAVGVGVWIVRQPVTAKATHVFERVEAALDVAGQGLDQVKTSVTRAAVRLSSVRVEQKKHLTEQPRTADMARQFLARTVQQTIAPDINNAHEKLHTVAEATVVVNTMLEDLGNFRFLSATGLDVGRLAEINSDLSLVESSTWELLRLLGEPGSAARADAAARSSQVESTLQTVRGLIDEYEPQLTQVRQQTEALKSRTLPWITTASILISVVCTWVALSQVNFMFQAWSWWRHSCLSNTGPIGHE